MAIMKKLLILLLFIPYLGFSQIKISALTEATTLNANDWFMAVQGGTTKKVAFYRFSYNQDSTALQITDSLAFYVQKTELSDSLLNYILRAELNDSLANYTSLDSLTYYMKTIDVRNAISDSIAGISSVSLGTANQVAFVNSTGTDLAYSDNFKWNDTTLLITDGNDNIFIGYNSGKNRTASISNVFIGVESGLGNTEGNYNIFNGYNSGKNATVGNSNVFLGAFSGFGTTTGERNIFIGYNSGYSYNGSGNIFIGDNSGYNETGSNKLYIENSTSATPLIYGDFANDSVRINGTLDVTGNVIVKGIMNIAKAEVLYTNTSQTTIITLPVNTVIWNVGVEVVTEFDDTGTDLLDIGVTATQDFFVSNQNLYNGGGGSFFIDSNNGLSASNIPNRITGSTNITFKYTGQNSDATQGQAFVYIHYSLH